ncbi:MAG: hypothetical protein EB136_10425 [Synechococcaceae bacterium WBB_3_034]|nr:hypothetical protein [Synechococcaceae bacterium WBB_3_034]
MLQPMPATDAAGDAQARVEKFFGWFRQLEPADQEALIKLVYNEHKIRDVVRTFAGMPTDQRQAVFQRLGLPNDLLSRIPPPTPGQVEEVEVEWKEWDSAAGS